MTYEIFDTTPCSLGEGPLWHPERQSLFWFDINGCTLFEKFAETTRRWQFDRHVSAAGWVDEDTLLVAEEHGLIRLSLASDTRIYLCEMESDNPVTRPNDGRADPWGGFWIGTMGKQAEAKAGAYYRYYKGELRQLYADWTIPNATCFAPDRSCAYIADTPRQTIWRVALDAATGWPSAEPVVFMTLPEDRYRPDGAVIDSEGRMWLAHYGHSKVTCHAPDGTELESHALPGRQITCPAFGGADLASLYATSAAQGLDPAGAHDGQTFKLSVTAIGQAEHRVSL